MNKQFIVKEIQRTWKDKRIRKDDSPHYYSGKLKIQAITATWMDREILIPSESDRERQISYDIVYMWNPEESYKWSYLWNQNRVTDIENKLMVTGEGAVRTHRKVGIDTYTLLYITQITNKDLLYSTGNSTQYSIMAYIGKESKKRVDICICITDSLCCICEINTIL